MEFLDGAGIDDAWGMAKWRNLCVWQLSETRRDGSNVQVTPAADDIYRSMLVLLPFILRHAFSPEGHMEHRSYNCGVTSSMSCASHQEAVFCKQRWIKSSASTWWRYA